MDTDAETQSFEDLERQLRETQQENAQLRQRITAKRSEWRKFVAYACLILGLIAVIPAGLLIWANRTVTDTNQYVNAVGPAIHEPAVQKAIVKSATTALYSSVNIEQEVANILPSRAQPLAAPITGQVKGYINSTVANVVASGQFANLWVTLNRRVQTRFMQVAQSGNTSDVIDVNRLYQFISEQLRHTPLAGLAGKSLPPRVGQIKLITIPALAKIPHFVNTLSYARWIFLGLAVALLIAAVAFARDRRRMTFWVGVGWMLATITGLIILRITRTILLGQISDPTYQQAASEIWQTLLTSYYLQTAILFLIGLVVASAGWIAGPAPVAMRLRSASLGFLASRRTSWLPQADSSRIVSFLRHNHPAALWLILVVTIIVLLMLVPLTIASLTVVLLSALIVWLVLEFFVATASPQKAK